MLSLDIDLFFLLVLFFLVAVPLTSLVRTRWSRPGYLHFVEVVVVLGVLHGVFREQLVDVLKIPMLALWDLPRDYGVWFVEGTTLGMQVKFVVPGALSLSIPYVISQNIPRPFATPTILVLQGSAVAVGMFLAAFLYPAIVTLTLIPREEMKTTGHPILSYDEGVHIAALVVGLVCCAIATDGYLGKPEARRVGYFSCGPKWTISLALAAALLGAIVESQNGTLVLFSAVLLATITIYGVTTLAAQFSERP